ncbi:uncharacterized protein BCR38DRAFT_68561 [Pseudomassariella vexata]|uniref:Uncharacterized protein n=1 Tax=Pseudomassariella vexata TaxID=1141098 RepID=A0A1Y2DHM6_9PEZI|nr:uncharacterized protein BCR38DRAFT_68561 [Pseudomassariella vexata]ORY58728.1 hypothetical protein BCR38DRAFT_68561 [Pseudomassariella vexata]
MMNAVFTMHGISQLAGHASASRHGGVQRLAVPRIQGGQLLHELVLRPICRQDVVHHDRFGGVPDCTAFYFRLAVLETRQYTFDVAEDVQKAIYNAKAYRSGKWGEGNADEIPCVVTRAVAHEQLEVGKTGWGEFSASNAGGRV